ncbi:galanin receptor 2a-like [Ptychodera flava]|uniref:galanin receptor 2a-like n=1 Tax=Ptychodera flava TaxID=63121 RepID=UPI00396A475C
MIERVPAMAQNDTFHGVGGKVGGPDNSVFRWLLAGISLGNSFLIVVGNLLVIAAIYRRKHLANSVTNHFIASVSVSDICVGVLFVPIRVLSIFGLDGLSNEFLCDSVMTVSWSSLNSTIFSLLSIAIDRYRAIVTPMKRQISIKQARMMILLTWFASFVYSCNQIAIHGVISKTFEVNGQNVTILKCDFIESVYDVKIVALTDFLLVYFIPLVVISVLYAKMINVLYFGNSPNDVSRKRKRRAIKMLIIVVVMFAIGWCPLRVRRILFFYMPNLVPEAQHRTMQMLSVTIALANSWINPFIYAIFGSNFRREFASILNCGRGSDETKDKKSPNSVQKLVEQKARRARFEDSSEQRTASTEQDSGSHATNQDKGGISTPQAEDEDLGNGFHSDGRKNPAYEN